MMQFYHIIIQVIKTSSTLYPSVRHETIMLFNTMCQTSVRVHKILRRNPPEVWVTSGQKPSAKITYIILQTCVTVLNIFSKKIFLATPNVEKKCLTLYETLESIGEMKLMTKFYLCLHNFSELWNLFSLVPMGNCFWFYFR